METTTIRGQSAGGTTTPAALQTVAKVKPNVEPPARPVPTAPPPAAPRPLPARRPRVTVAAPSGSAGRQARAKKVAVDHRHRARVIAVTSGKGGVGKSNLVANLAVGISRLGKSVLAFDADLGLANLDVLFGVRPRFTLYHVLKGRKELLDIIIAGAPGVKFIAGGSGMHELADMDTKDKSRFIGELQKLERYSDVIVIDTGAGLSTNVISFVRAADEVLLVTTPEPTAMADAYGILKTLVGTGEVFPKTNLIVNRVRSPEEGTFVARRVAKVASEFLDVKVGYAGFVIEDPVVSQAVRAQKPFLGYAPNALASVCVCNIVANLFNSKVVPPPARSSTFFDRLAGMFRG